MGIRNYKPVTPGRRFMSLSTFDEITREKPEKGLIVPLKKTGGRNSYGRITSRFRGGGHRQAYRLVDFRRDKDDIPAKVTSIEYDPVRTARIALLQYKDGEKRYILAPLEMRPGSTVISTRQAQVDITPGNAMPIKYIPSGTIVHNIEVHLGRGGQLVRSAGAGAQIMAKEGPHAHIRLPSGEVRAINIECKATIGQIGNIDRENISIGKAGRSRWLGKRPHNRGVSMNPVDHPHGGGEGKSGQGNPHPVTPWGLLTKGFKTRKKKPSDRYIIKRRG